LCQVLKVVDIKALASENYSGNSDTGLLVYY